MLRRNFGTHAEFEDVLSHLQVGIDNLLNADKPHFAAWLGMRERMFPIQSHSTPLYHVAEFGFRGMVHYLISKHPESRGARSKYGTPLHVALKLGHADVALLLLGHCVDVDARSIDDLTPLHLAARCGFLEVTRILIERRYDATARSGR
jgi:ankyrin repeat protein